MKNEDVLKTLSNRMSKRSRKLMVVKRKDPSSIKLLPEDELKDLAVKAKYDNFFHKHFQTRIAITHGDVFMVDLNYECGNELSGPHFVVATNDSKALDPIVTVVPLKSYKGVLNPRSDVLLGIVEGTTTGNQSIALINQIKGIDKSRMIEHVSDKTLKKILADGKIAEDDEIEIRVKTVYRLTDRQFNILKKALNDFINFGYIQH